MYAASVHVESVLMQVSARAPKKYYLMMEKTNSMVTVK